MKNHTPVHTFACCEKFFLRIKYGKYGKTGKLIAPGFLFNQSPKLEYD